MQRMVEKGDGGEGGGGEKRRRPVFHTKQRDGEMAHR